MNTIVGVVILMWKNWMPGFWGSPVVSPEDRWGTVDSLSPQISRNSFAAEMDVGQNGRPRGPQMLV